MTRITEKGISDNNRKQWMQVERTDLMLFMFIYFMFGTGEGKFDFQRQKIIAKRKKT